MVMTAIAIGLTIASIAMQAKAAHDAGQAAAAAGDAQQQAANSQADIADFNAGVADLQAKDAVEKGAVDEANFRSQVKGAIGAQRGGLAANNVDVGYGSAVDVQADAAHLGELDALTIRSNAARQAWGFQVQATDLRRGADIARKTGIWQAAAGQQAASTANTAALGNILGGASLLASKYGMGGEA